jgi:hypothetical protein
MNADCCDQNGRSAGHHPGLDLTIHESPKTSVARGGFRGFVG